MKLIENIITIDGPSGVGKGTLAFSLAKKLGWNVLDSGLIYRLIGYLSLRKELETSKEIVSLINKSKKQGFGFPMEQVILHLLTLLETPGLEIHP